MKKTLLSVLSVLLLWAWTASAATWNSAGLLGSPTANTILAEAVNTSGSDNLFHWQVQCSATVVATVVVEHRDTTNATNISGETQGFFIPASGTVATPPGPVVLLAGERIRIRLNSAITGSIQCSVLLE